MSITHSKKFSHLLLDGLVCDMDLRHSVLEGTFVPQVQSNGHQKGYLMSINKGYYSKIGAYKSYNTYEMDYMSI